MALLRYLTLRPPLPIPINSFLAHVQSFSCAMSMLTTGLFLLGQIRSGVPGRGIFGVYTQILWVLPEVEARSHLSMKGASVVDDEDATGTRCCYHIVIRAVWTMVEDNTRKFVP